MSQLKFLLCNFRIDSCDRKDPRSLLHEEQELEKMTKQIYFFLYIHDTEAHAFSWTISTFVACVIAGLQSPLLLNQWTREGATSYGSLPGPSPSAAGWRRKFPLDTKVMKRTGHFLSVWQTPRDLFLFTIVNLSQLQPTRCACPEMFSAQVIFPSFVKIEHFIFRGCKRLHSKTL